MMEIVIVLAKTIGLMLACLVVMFVVVFGYQIYDYLDAKYSKEDKTNWDLY